MMLRGGASPRGPGHGLRGPARRSPWSPARLGSSLEYWLIGDPSFVTQDENGFVSEVAEQSGHGHRTGAPSELQQPQLQLLSPTVGLFAFGGSERFDVASDLADAMPADNWSLCAVVQTDAPTTNQCYTTIGGAAAGYALVNDASGALGERSGGVGVAKNGASDTDVHAVVLTRSGGTLRMYVDGIGVTLDAPGISVSHPSGATIIGALTDSLWYVSGLVGEVLAVSRVMSGDAGIGSAATGEIHKFTAYAVKRYGL